MKNIDGTIQAANKLIAEACNAEYHKAQYDKNGKLYKKYHPYSIPDWCIDLQKVIMTENEHDIKAAMVAVRAGCYSLV